jgi:hypothetical protein
MTTTQRIGALLALALTGCTALNMTGLDGANDDGAGGAFGAGGSLAGAGGADALAATGGAGGALGRANGAGCTTYDQCSSGICVAGTCCDGRPDECNTCVGGYKTPIKDGTACGDQKPTCDGSLRRRTACTRGVCGSYVEDCTVAVCNGSGVQMCPPHSGVCGTDGQEPAGYICACNGLVSVACSAP